MIPYDRRLKKVARRLRTEMTEAEKMLWSRLRKRQIFGALFYRQKPIGPYVADFYSPVAQLVVEVDGGQHFFGEGVRSDVARDVWFRSKGINVLRFNNHEVLTQLQVVVEAVGRDVVRGQVNPLGDRD